MNAQASESGIKTTKKLPATKTVCFNVPNVVAESDYFKCHHILKIFNKIMATCVSSEYLNWFSLFSS